MDQLPLGPVARRTDPETSHQAAADARPGAATLRARCFAALMDAGPDGLTDFELAERVGSIQTSAGKRRGELVTFGLVEFAEVFRLSPHGSKARVWRTT